MKMGKKEEEKRVTYFPLLIASFVVFPIPSSIIVLVRLVLLTFDMPGKILFVFDNLSF